MLDPRLERAGAEILAVLETASAEGTSQLASRELIRRAMGQGSGEEAVRVALWDLIDQRTIELTSDRQVRLTDQKPADQAAVAS